jgi:hypothetical protein
MSEELAWASGFFSGEGSTSFKYDKRGYGALCLQADQVRDREVLDRLQLAVGEGKVYGPYGRKEVYKFSASANQAERIVYKLWPWLSEIKREQARRALEKMHEYRRRPKKKPGPKPKLACSS